jgi:hypothetical protein
LAEARNVQAAILAAVQNSLQLKILQRGGALGDAQIGWPSRLPLRSDRRHVEKTIGMVAVADFEFLWAEGRNKRLAETYKDFAEKI